MQPGGTEVPGLLAAALDQKYCQDNCELVKQSKCSPNPAFSNGVQIENTFHCCAGGVGDKNLSNTLPTHY